MTETTPKPTIFISYSRKDGEDFSLDLGKRLKAQGLTIWKDRDKMEGGVGWWKQITDALDNVKFMVLIATPAALNSEIVRKEWRYARQCGVCVYPVQVPGLAPDFDAMPKWMRDSHFYNLDKEWDTFINHLKSPCTAPKIPFMTPDLPDNFVQRPVEFNAIKAQLLDKTFDNPVAITTALKGAGGFGKTTLAMALCHDEDVQTAFDEGVLWVTIGQTPDISQSIAKLYEALTGEQISFIDPEQGANKLAEKLEDADVLMVIDDVWDIKHLRPFLRGGKRCARLITTRFSNIALDAKAQSLEVNEMESTEAVQLLLSGIKAPEDLSPFERLAKRLGEWALMLEVTNGMLRKRLSKDAGLNNALDYVNKALDKRGIAGLKDGSHELAMQVLDASIEQINEEQRSYLFELSIFVDDADIPLTSVMALWDLDDFDTEEMVDLFDDLSFIQWDAGQDIIRLHDVVREILHLRLVSPPAIHQRLIAHYSDLKKLPDTYAWHNIGYHFKQAGQLEQLRALLLDYDWLYAKLDATDTRALIPDYDYFPRDDKAMGLMKSLFGMSDHILDQHIDQLPYQITGRLWVHRDQPDLAGLWRYAQTQGALELIETQEYPPMLQAGGALLRTLVGHTSSVKGAIQLKDGCFLSWSMDNTLRLWDNDGQPLAVLKEHIGWINGALALDDGRFLSWSDDTTLRLWDNNGQPLAVLEGHKSQIIGALALDDGRFLSWAGDTTLRLWDNNGQPLAILGGHTYAVTGALVLNDRRLLSWSDDNTLRLWNHDGKPLTIILEGHTKSVYGALALNNGRLLSWSDDNTLRLWDNNGQPLAIMEGHTYAVKGAIQLKDGRILSWSDDNTLRLWNNDGQQLAVLEGHTQPVNGALALDDGRFLSWSWDSTLRLWDNNGQPLAVLEGHTDLVYGALVLEDGRFLSWSYDSTLRLWDNDGQPLAVLEGHTNQVLGALAVNDGRFLSWSDDNTLRLWNNDGESINTSTEHKNSVNGTLALNDGRFLSWSMDKTLRLWDNDGQPLAVLEGHTDWVYGSVTLDDGRFLSWSMDSTLRLWDHNGQPLAILEGHTDWVYGALVLEDGRFLSWSYDSTLRLWNHDGQALAVMKGHTEAVYGALPLNDGRFLSWAEVTLRLWDKHGQPLAVMEGHTKSVYGALALEDGRFLSWSRDRTLRLWDNNGQPLAVMKGHTHSVHDALVLEDGRFLSWSRDRTLRLWDNNGQPLAVMEEHRDSIYGALILNDGRILSWSDDKTLRLWDSNGQPLAVLEDWQSDKTRLNQWANKHHFDVNILYNTDNKSPVQYRRSTLKIENIGQFIGDARFAKPSINGQTIVVGDEAGRVIFLRIRDKDQADSLNI